jgi:hypothetical protein
MFTFGDDGSGFDWSSILSTAITSAGQVTSAALTGQQQAAGYPYTPGAINPATGLPYNPLVQPTATSNTLLFAAALGLGVILFMKMKKRR